MMENEYFTCSKTHYSELIDSIQWFKRFQKRSEVIKEVILDQELLNANSRLNDGKTAWNYHFVVDFHQIFALVFPPIVKISSSEVNNEVFPFKFDSPSEEEIISIAYNRLTKAIPFFANIKVDKPILIPSYLKELDIRIKMQFDRLIRLQLYFYLNHMTLKAEELLNKWTQSVENLNTVSVDRDVRKLKKQSLIFSNLTAQGLYYISLANSVTLDTLKYLLKGRNNQSHIRELDSKYCDIITDKEIVAWLTVLNKKRPNKLLSNTLDAEAISMVNKLNEISFKEKRKDLYFLLSDAPLFYKFFKGKYRRILDENNLLYTIERSDLPINLYNQSLNILRTSDHFEEWIRAYPTNNNKKSVFAIDDLKNYRELNFTLIKRNSDISTIVDRMKENINSVLRKCKKSKCIKDNNLKCYIVIKDINKIKKSQVDYYTLKDVIGRKKVFKNLLEFLTKCLENSNIPSYKALENKFSSFFITESKKYTTVWEMLNKVFEKNEVDYFYNLKKLVSKKNYIEAEISKKIYEKLFRMNGILFQKIYSGDDQEEKEIRTILKELNDDFYIDKKHTYFDSIKWYSNLIRTTTGAHSIKTLFLILVIKYCFFQYDDVSSQCERLINNNIDIIIKCNMLIEYKYLYLLAKYRLFLEEKHNDKQHIESVINSIINEAHLLMLKYKDERLNLLLGKLYLWSYFHYDADNSFLDLAYDNAQDGLNSINNRIGDGINYDPLKIRLINLVVYAVSKMKNPSDDLINCADIYYKRLLYYCSLINIHETIACWEYFNFHQKKILDPSLADNCYRKAIRNLEGVILKSKDSFLDPRDVKKLISQKNEWEKEYSKWQKNREKTSHR